MAKGNEVFAIGGDVAYEEDIPRKFSLFGAEMRESFSRIAGTKRTAFACTPYVSILCFVFNSTRG